MIKSKKVFLHFLTIGSIILSITLLSFFSNSSLINAETSFLKLLLQVASGFLVFMLPPVYLTSFWFIPALFEKRKYILFTVSIIVTAVIWGLLSSTLETWMDENWFGEKAESNGYAAGISIMFFIIFLTSLVNLSYKSIKQFAQVRELENDHLKMELMMLKNQINPHFLFNTLNSLYALSIEKSEQTPEVILKLSDLLRYTIYDCARSEVSIKNEINYLENYIDLQQVRLSDQCEILFSKSVSNSQVKIAPMLLIVFLENAFKHGVETLAENAFIHVKLLSTEKTFEFRLVNNFNENENTLKGGLGLDNIKRRLSLIYTDNYSLDVSTENDKFSIVLKLAL